MEITNLLDKTNSFAIIGASNDPDKYGCKIFSQLINKGFEVYPINNKVDLILGFIAYPNIDALPKKVDVLNFVVPANVSLDITKHAIDLGYKVFWYQPGSFDEAVLTAHKGKGTTVIKDFCLLVESSKL